MTTSKLHSTFNLRGVKLSNRIVMSPMLLRIATEDGEVTREIIDHYVLRAKGGVGLIIAAGAYVTESGKVFPNTYGISDDRHVPGLRRLVEAVHSQNAMIAVQLHHYGARTPSAVIGEQPAVPRLQPGHEGVTRMLK